MARREPTPHGPSLFEATARRNGEVPLAERVRPRRLEEVAGHEKLIGKAGPLARFLAAGRLPSLILWGPPGSGKTTLAHVIAEQVRATFVPFSAVLGGIAEVRVIVEQARARRAVGQGMTVLFIDEIHRFNKAQQDSLLPHVEDGAITLVGATTENPSFALNAPLLSRCQTYRLDAHPPAALVAVLRRALVHAEGLAGRVDADEDALLQLAEMARGDARRALNLLDLAAEATTRDGHARIDCAAATALAGHATLLYDKTGEEHFNVISAFIKSMRGSDPDAAVYWMMRMVEAGDDPSFVLRRMLIFASEDVGNADPRALELTVAADAAFRRLGLPEGLYPMAQAAIYLACAPKSNAANLAWHRAQERIAETGALPVPHHLRNAPTALMRDEGYGEGYRYPHDEAGGHARGATYLPDALIGERYYHPTTRGLEAKLGEWLRKLRSDGGGENSER
ncbi:MAG: replication-associated recombination protein A [Myxococcales bacterium]|nr:replication-associated recombination protein A [Myxococcales bacterium]